ncbi:MAG: hypothetical protein BWZ08_01558 [candidate division BRC1 bacterium ADurb.BinA292]|nr:MAG: hypothetical protein BWZ08_01558 [candidate division BRC1 bacterium ADurb.BinA292]
MTPPDPSPPPRECDVEILPPADGPLTAQCSSAPRPTPHPLRYLFSYVPGVTTLVALWLYLLDEHASSLHKLSIVLTFLYFVWPLDLLKDLFVGLGYLDDLAIFYGLVRFIGSETLRPYRLEARRWLRGLPPLNPHIAP